MEKNEVNKIIQEINTIYYGKLLRDRTDDDVKNLSNSWYDILKDYNYEDVKKNLDNYAKKDEYNNVPQCYLLTKGLIPNSKKIDTSKGTFYCQFCKKPCHSYNKLIEHEDRCRSINYVIDQTKRFGGRNINRAELWNMPQDDFKIKYINLLHYVHDHTTNELEKNAIEHIFNPTF